MLANERYAVTHVDVDTAGQCLVSHSLTRRKGLVNHVEFLGLAHTFVTLY